MLVQGEAERPEADLSSVLIHEIHNMVLHRFTAAGQEVAVNLPPRFAKRQLSVAPELNLRLPVGEKRTQRRNAAGDPSAEYRCKS